MNLDKIKHIHFMGIKGVGMTSLACIATDYGIKVTGSDTGESFVTDQILKDRNINVYEDFKAEQITNNHPDLVVYTAAHKGADNVEVQTAKANDIATLSFGEALGMFFNTKTGISVAGVGGKTTTSAMLATIFETADQNPSFMVGVGEVSSLPVPGKYNPDGDLFITEADEYACSPDNHRPKFYYQHPKTIILTNLAFDHPDVYADERATLATFYEFATKLPHDGHLIVNGDAPMLKTFLKQLDEGPTFQANIITYGQDSSNDWQIVDYQVQNGKALITLDDPDDNRTEYLIQIPGEYNAKNAVAAIITSLIYGLTKDQIQTGLDKFTGTKRRFEKIAEQNTNLIYDDYAHHPDEIKATLKAAREWLPDKKIIAIFQPHTFSRTKVLLEDFAQSFEDADHTMIMDIFPSAREPFDDSITSAMLVEKIKQYHADPDSITLNSTSGDIISGLKSLDITDTVIFTIGAGDVYKLHSDIAKLL